jgi:hypothetical protein
MQNGEGGCESSLSLVITYRLWNQLMNERTPRHHYVSRVLLERFRRPGKPLECYGVKNRKWKQRSVERACSALGYNQVLQEGDVNDAIENSFSKVESNLPKTLKALERAAKKSSTELPKEIYENLCLYCAFLKRTSLFAKPGAVVSFLAQLNMELEKGEFYLFRELKVPDEIVAELRKNYALGGRVIIESDNIVQLVYRIQFGRLLNLNYWEFLNCDWTISNSPVELPMSDMGIIQIQLTGHDAIQYLLPISPTMILDGIFYHDLSKNSTKAMVGGHHLSKKEAEYRYAALCLSAVREIVFSRRPKDIDNCLESARTMGVTFAGIANLEMALSAGLRNCSSQYRLQMVSIADYVRFVHSFVLPPHLKTECDERSSLTLCKTGS